MKREIPTIPTVTNNRKMTEQEKLWLTNLVKQIAQNDFTISQANQMLNSLLEQISRQ